MRFDTVIAGGTAVLPERGLVAADIAVREGRVAALIEPGDGPVEAARVIDASGKHVFPGLIDAHIHFGFAEPLTEYGTETVYAAQGGVTTVLGYFLNNEPYSEVYDEQLAEAESRCHVDFGFHFSTARDVHLEELGRYVTELGVTSFKYFMNFKGEEGRYLGLDGTDDGFMYDLLAATAAHEGVVLVMHTENIELVSRLRLKFQREGRDSFRDWCDSKPPFTETESVVRAMVFAEETGARIYIPHLSCAPALEEVRRYRGRYDRVHVETCPHYLTHHKEMDLCSIGKANPPFRAPEDTEALWAGLADGTIDVVASDHVPRKRATKEKGIWQASQGFPGTATILPVLLSEGYHKGRLGLQRIAQLLTSRPAEIFGIDRRKGFLTPGADADITVVDLDREREVKADELGSYSDYSLYEGWILKGWPVLTMVRGQVVMEDGRIVGPPGHGTYLKRPLA